MSDIGILIYEGKNGTRVELKPSQDFETMWATQEQISQIFERDVGTISRHIGNIFSEGELDEKSNLQKMQIANSDKPVGFYSLNVIIAVGYRVNSAIATQFRIWATKILQEYIIKGFAMDDERLKDPTRNQYFDELLERIRSIRASEKLFYQKIRDIFTTAIDYDKKMSTEEGKNELNKFFATIQNKFFYAIVSKTAAELVIERHNIEDKNFGLTNWKGFIVLKEDVCIAKNYLTNQELDLLERIVVMFLDLAEVRATTHKQTTIEEWKKKLDQMLQLNDFDVLTNAGTISRDDMLETINFDYKSFNNKRKTKEKEDAEKEALKDIEIIDTEIKDIMRKRKSKKPDQSIDDIIKENPDLANTENNDFEKVIKKTIKPK